MGKEFAQSLEAEWKGEIIHDPLQQARVTFMRCGRPDSPAMELLEPETEKSPLQKFLVKGGGLHHICYEVASLYEQLEYCRSVGSLIVKQPLPAAAFGGRRIAWVYNKGFWWSIWNDEQWNQRNGALAIRATKRGGVATGNRSPDGARRGYPRFAPAFGIVDER